MQLKTQRNKLSSPCALSSAAMCSPKLLNPKSVYVRKTRFRQLPTFTRLWESVQENLGLVEPKKKIKFTGRDYVVRIECRAEYDQDFLEAMWLTKKDKKRAMDEAMEEVFCVGGMVKWKSLEWIE